MTSISLADLWLNDAADPTDVLVLPLQPGGGGTWPNAVEVREYADGVFIPVTRPGVSQSWTPLLRRLTLPQWRELTVRAGRLHWARDPWGGKIACTWSNPAPTFLGLQRDTGVQMVTVALTLVQSTLTEA